MKKLLFIAFILLFSVNLHADIRNPYDGGSLSGDVTLDDGSGDSPNLIFKDGSDTTYTFYKDENGHLIGENTVASKSIRFDKNYDSLSGSASGAVAYTITDPVGVANVTTYGFYGIDVYNSASSSTGASINGVYGHAQVLNGHGNQMTGVLGRAEYYGSLNNPVNMSLYGMRTGSYLNSAATGVVDHGVGIKIDSPQDNGGSATFNEVFGVYIDDMDTFSTPNTDSTAMHIEGVGKPNSISWSYGNGSTQNMKLYPSALNELTFATTDIVVDSETVGNNDDGTMFKVKRVAPEGTNTLEMFVDSTQTTRIRADSYTAIGDETNDVSVVSNFNLGKFVTANKTFEHYGNITGQGIKYVQFQLDDTDDYYRIQPEDSNVQGLDLDFSIVEQNGVKTIAGVESVADDGTFTLPTTTTGTLTIFVEGDNENATCHIQDDGTVTIPISTGSVANADTDTNLCIITGADPVVVKNRLGSEKTIVYTYTYK